MFRSRYRDEQWVRVSPLLTYQHADSFQSQASEAVYCICLWETAQNWGLKYHGQIGRRPSVHAFLCVFNIACRPSARGGIRLRMRAKGEEDQRGGREGGRIESHFGEAEISRYLQEGRTNRSKGKLSRYHDPLKEIVVCSVLFLPDRGTGLRQPATLPARACPRPGRHLK